MKNRACRVGAIWLKLSGGYARKYFYPGFNGPHWPDMELAGPGGFQDLFLEHQVGHIAFRDENSLFTGQPDRLADLEITFDLLIHTPDGLNLSFLIDRTSYGNTLANGNPG